MNKPFRHGFSNKRWRFLSYLQQVRIQTILNAILFFSTLAAILATLYTSL